MTLSKHIAFKCTYNDGGEGVYVGYNGTCSNKIIEYNIKIGKVWCNQEECECNQYFYDNFNGDIPESPCYESVLFKDWLYGAGIHHTGERAGEPIHITNVNVGRYAILTTRFPYDIEEERKVIGFFRIGKIENSDEGETFLHADEKMRMRLPLSIAKQMNFWKYYTTRGGSRWGTGLFRYLDNEPIAAMLYDLSQIIEDEASKKLLYDSIKHDLAPNKILREKKIV